jgi:YbbR domain-containing protein
VKQIVHPHLLLGLVALLTAGVLWLSVAADPMMASFVSVPVEYKGLPEDLEIASDVFESVYLELRGPSEQLRNYREHSPAVVLDMSNVRAGERTFSITDTNLDLGRGLRLVRAIPAQLRFQFEPRAMREVPVEVRFIKSPPQGYGIASYEVIPRTLRILGPQSHVAKVNQVMTDPVDLGNVVGPAEFRVNVFAGDSLVRFAGSPRVVVRVTIKKA